MFPLGDGITSQYMWVEGVNCNCAGLKGITFLFHAKMPLIPCGL